MTSFILIFIVVLFCHPINSSNTAEEIKHLVGKLSHEDRLSSLPCSCAKEDNYGGPPKHKGNPMKERRFRKPPLLAEKSRLPIARQTETDPEERRERMNESMARFMQLMTIVGHVDNFLTQKTGEFLKVMGKAVESEEDGYADYSSRPRYRIARRPSPRITTTISS